MISRPTIFERDDCDEWSRYFYQCSQRQLNKDRSLRWRHYYPLLLHFSQAVTEFLRLHSINVSFMITIIHSIYFKDIKLSPVLLFIMVQFPSNTTSTLFVIFSICTIPRRECLQCDPSPAHQAGRKTRAKSLSDWILAEHAPWSHLSPGSSSWDGAIWQISTDTGYQSKAETFWTRCYYFTAWIFSRGALRSGLYFTR